MEPRSALSPRSRTAKPISARAPLFAPTQSTATPPQWSPGRPTLGARHLRRSRGRKGLGWCKVRAPRVASASGARRGCSRSRHEERRVSQRRARPGAHGHDTGPGGARATTHHPGRATAAAAAETLRAPARSASCPGLRPGAGGCGLGGGSGRPGGRSVGASRGGLAVARTAGR